MIRPLVLAVAFLVLGAAHGRAAETQDDPRALLKNHRTYIVGSLEPPPPASGEARIGVHFGRVLAARFQLEVGLSVGIPLGGGADLRLRYVLPSLAVPNVGRLFFIAGFGPTLNLLGGFLGVDPAREQEVLVDPSHVFHVLAVAPEVGFEFRVPFQPRGRMSGVFRLLLGVPIVLDHDMGNLCRLPAVDESSPCAFEFIPTASARVDRGWWFYLRQTVGLAW